MYLSCLYFSLKSFDPISISVVFVALGMVKPGADQDLTSASAPGGRFEDIRSLPVCPPMAP